MKDMLASISELTDDSWEYTDPKQVFCDYWPAFLANIMLESF
jgi:hypothetical protein